MNKVEWAQLRSALKALNDGPKRIGEAKNEYNAAAEYMKKNRRTWSEQGQENFYKAIAEKRDAAIQGEVSKMSKALATVRGFKDYPGETVDLESVKLQNALNIVRLMGKGLPHTQQLQILEQFRGRPAELAFLGDVYAAHGLYFSQYAKDMAAPVSQEALDNMEQALAYAEWNGNFDEGRIYWTRSAFADYAERMGLDSDTTDPYVAALKTMRTNEVNPENQRVLSATISEMMHDGTLTDEQKTKMIEEATSRIRQSNLHREYKEIEQQAKTQETLNGLVGITQDVENLIDKSFGGAN